MAKINNLKETSSVNGSKWNHLLLTAMFSVLTIIVFFLGVVYFLSTNNILLAIFSIGLVVVFSALSNQQFNLFNRCSMIEHSYEVTNHLLSGLPDSYTIYNNVFVNDAKLDHVVVGNNGIFIVINRTVKGVIHCDDSEKRWMIDKTGRSGGSYTSEMPNPMKQLRWQIHTLSKYLKDNGVNIWIDGCVYFSNSDSDLLNKPSNCFDSDKDVASFILNYSPKKKLNPQMINQAKDCLEV